MQSKKPKLYSFEEHLIPHEKIDSHAYYIIEKLKQAGFLAYLVGGGVRDLLLHLKPKDFDISTSAKPEQVKQLFKNCILIGKRFRLAHIRFGNKIFEVATFRAGDPQQSQLILRDNVWGNEEEDALRRDFTINGLFYDPENQTVIDYVEGFSDAKKKLLRSIGKAHLRFHQDPVRMIRLLKFQARLKFSIDPPAQEALLECKDEIIKSSSPRILEELLRMLELGCARDFFLLLHTHGLLSLLLPNLSQYLDQGPENGVYRYLEQIDLFQQKHHTEKLPRTVLLSCLLFPLFQEKIDLLCKKSSSTPHLGMIAEEAHELIDFIFLPFFHISRKMKGGLASTLVQQYRFVPCPSSSKSLKRSLRVPNDPFFKESLEFFKIRTLLEPHLLTSYTEWNEAFVSFHLAKKTKKTPPHSPETL